MVNVCVSIFDTHIHGTGPAAHSCGSCSLVLTFRIPQVVLSCSQMVAKIKQNNTVSNVVNVHLLIPSLSPLYVLRRDETKEK